jgi:hypothetical protein
MLWLCNPGSYAFLLAGEDLTISPHRKWKIAVAEDKRLRARRCG